MEAWVGELSGGEKPRTPSRARQVQGAPGVGLPHSREGSVVRAAKPSISNTVETMQNIP